MEQQNSPYKNLGEALANIRQRLSESIDEASGAVEIDNTSLKEIESGTKRPSEDILELLINHYSLKDDEADKLWRLAGYSEFKAGPQNSDFQLVPQPVIVMPIDSRVIYSDAMNLVINGDGVVINFLQTAGPNQTVPAARVGMTLSQAKKVAETLSETIRLAEQGPKFLPSPKNDNKAK